MRPVAADGHGRTRQVLVVGDGLAGTTTAGFLDQAGLDPVVVSTTDHARTGVVVLWEPGLALLERLGLRRPVQRLGTPLSGLACRTTGRKWTGGNTTRPSLVAVPRKRLRELLDTQVLDRLRTTDQPVKTLYPADAGVQADFEGSVREPFDAVVVTIRSRLPSQSETLTPATFDTWSFEWSAAAPPPAVATEAWDSSRAAFTVPVPDGVQVRLVSVADRHTGTAVSTGELEEQFGHLFGAAGNPFQTLDQHSLQYDRRPCVSPRSLVESGVALVGADAQAAIPGDCLGPSLAVEDAWVLADVMAYGPAEVEDALAEYDRRRRRRATAVASVTEGLAPDRISVALSPRLERLRSRRSLAFSHALDTRKPALDQSVPRCL